MSSIGKVRTFAEKRSIGLTDKTLATKEKAGGFLTDTADFFLFLISILKETFSRGFEFML